ncbi:hydantoinase/oxoprolinase family protein [Streptosporangium sp. NPDC006007]|uniref:hydantoinase/oxoprolinase family protein n=1 Tax=Streptosporangium sp. NPDC006007 TaxID=3154575 RepID=UPI0033A16CE1
MTGHRLGIDIGGTFTDLVLMDEATGELTALKTPSIPADPAEGIMAGIRTLVTRHGVDPRHITYFAHGQTFALNTVLQRGGARTGLLVTGGFRDLLAIGRLRLADPIDFCAVRPDSLVAPADVREIGERVRADGVIVRPLDLDEVTSAVADLVAGGVQALAICFLHSYAHPGHEQAAVHWIRGRFPGLYVSASHEVWPEQREYERATVTVLNSYVGARMAGYFERLSAKTAAVGIPATLRITKSNGGIMTAASASGAPVETLLSGPASGVTGAVAAARQSGVERFITLDMGGTSVDVAIVDGAVPYSSDSRLEEFPVIIPSVEISSIGAGGGSVAWIDPSGVLKIGPRSAGSDPGPACYGRGGTEPTVTDAYLAVGLLDADSFAGGGLRLDREAALAALTRLGASLGLDALRVAGAIIDVTTVKMYAQLMPLLARRGADPTDFAIVAYGGAGPTHAALLAQETGIGRVMIPWSPGTLCGLGSLITNLRQDFVRTLGVAQDSISDDELAKLYDAMAAQATAWLAEQGEQLDATVLEPSADVQFVGQSFTIAVPLAPDTPPTVAALRERFVTAYADAYGIRDDETPVEIRNLRLSIVGQIPKPEFVPRTRRGTPEPPGRRQIVERGQPATADVYQRDSLRPGDRLAGPAIVEAPDTTIYLPAGVTAVVDPTHSIIATVGGIDVR